MKKKIVLPGHRTLFGFGLALLIFSGLVISLITLRLHSLYREQAADLLRASAAENAGRDKNLPAAATAGEERWDLGGLIGFGFFKPRPLPAIANAKAEAEPAATAAYDPRQERIQALRAEAFQKAQAGDLAGAIANLDLALAQALPQDQDLLKRELSHLFAAQGWRQYQEKIYEKARGFFTEARFYWPENLEAIRGLAFCAFQERERSEAEGLLTTFFKLGGDRPEAYTLMGRLCYESDRLVEALNYFRISLTLSPEQPEVAELAAKIQRELKVEAGFGRSETRHFIVKYEGQESPELRQPVEAACEDAYLKVGQDLGYYPEVPVIVILYTDQQFRDVTRSPAWAGAVFDGKIRIPAKGLSAQTGELSRIILHEYTHAVVYEVTQGRAPVWLQEGLAQRSEIQTEAIGPVARRLAAAGGPLPLRSLEKGFLGMGLSQAELAYLESWLAIGYLTEKSGPFAVRELLRSLSEGDDIGAAIYHTTYRDYNAFDAEFRRWVMALAETGQE